MPVYRYNSFSIVEKPYSCFPDCGKKKEKGLWHFKILGQNRTGRLGKKISFRCGQFDHGGTYQRRISPMRKSDALRKARTFASRMHCKYDLIRFPSRDAEFNALMRECHFSYHRAEEIRRILRLADYVQVDDDACRRKPARGGDWECWRQRSVKTNVRCQKRKKSNWIVSGGKLTIRFLQIFKFGG